MISGIYKILNKANGKFYIGSSKNIHIRWKAHINAIISDRHDNTHLYNAYKKYGKDNFEFIILEECDEEVLLIREQYWLDITKCYDRDIGYNIAEIAGKPSNKEYIRTAEHSRNISIAKRGKKMPPRSQEYKDNLSKALKGRKFTDEHRLNMSKSRIGKKKNDEFKEKRRAYMTGRNGDKSSAGKIYKIIDPQGNIIEFKSMSNFCKQNNLDTRAMFAVLSGFRRRNGKIIKIKAHKGYTRYEPIQ